MSFGTIAVIIILAVLVFLVIRDIFRHGIPCASSCSGCACQGTCHGMRRALRRAERDRRRNRKNRA